jgi:hypothetical protein
MASPIRRRRLSRCAAAECRHIGEPEQRNHHDNLRIHRHTATANGVKDVTLDFGDGDSIDLGAINSASTVSHRYGSTGSYSVKATETDGSGNTTTAVTVVTVTP